LRRLLAVHSRVVTVVGARDGLGATSIVVNLAAVLAGSGKDVLVLDENLSHDNVANTLALKPRHDLLNVVRGDKTWQDVMLRGSQGVRVLPVARAMQSLPALDATQRECLLDSLSAAAKDMDVYWWMRRVPVIPCAPAVRRRAFVAGAERKRQRTLKVMPCSQMAMHNGRQALISWSIKQQRTRGAGGI
jgi:flagellar biosynthesis protein FlhG